MKREELNEILLKHKRWLEKSEGWTEEDRANLTGADLYRAYLTGADLEGANLTGADLSETNLSEANLSEADLTGDNLYRANLTGVNLVRVNLTRASLYRANLTEANLTEANLYGVNLIKVNLTGANLTGANLYRADLSGADLTGANLTLANLSEAKLTGAKLTGAKNITLIPFTCPDFGMFIGWKKASGKIVCLEIPEDSRRLSGTGRKCRCDKAKVLSITELNGDPCDLTEVPSDRDKNFIYKVGEVVSVPDFDDNRWNECSTGIHFFINRQEAVEW